MQDSTVLKIAAVADLHCRKNSHGDFQNLFKEASEAADVLVLCGDLTDNGTAEEAHVLLKELGPNKIPTLGVLGNHDYESDQAAELKNILTEGGITILDGESVEIRGVGFAGVKGFAGGFGPSMLGPWGESAIKQFVHCAVDEALKLEAALARLHTDIRVCLLHYAPIQTTVEGERPQIYAFLGSSRLEEPINRHSVSVVFHGHAHAGTAEGRTATGIPVYNVAMPLLRAKVPECKNGFRLFELELKTIAQDEPLEAQQMPPAA